MFVLIQFPIADLRNFQESPQIRLHMPEWPPKTGIGLQRFVRAFGSAKGRKQGADFAWTDESSFCDASRALRFAHLPNPKNANSWKSKSKCIFRRLLFDGQTVARIEIGIKYSQPQKINSTKTTNFESHTQDKFTAEKRQQLSPKTYIDPIQALENTLQLPTKSANYPGKKNNNHAPLIMQAPQLSKLFAYATTKQPNKCDQPANHSLVTPGNPLCLIECDKHSYNLLPKYFKQVPPEKIGGIRLSFGKISKFGGEIGVWVLEKNRTQSDFVRSLRLCLSRLHAERETLFTIINSLENNHLKFNSFSNEGDRLQDYLNRSTRIVDKKKWMGINQSNIIEAFIASESTPKDKQIKLISSRLSGARRQIIKKLEEFEKKSRQNQITNIYTDQDIHMTYQKTDFGTGNTFHESVTIAKNITDSFNRLQKSNLSEESKILLENLSSQISKISSDLYPNENHSISRDLAALSEEISSEQPRKAWLELTLNGIKSAAEKVGEIGKPIIETTEKLLPLLISIVK